MNRRAFLNLAPLAAAIPTLEAPAYAQAPFADEKSKLRITGVRRLRKSAADFLSKPWSTLPA